MSRFDYVKYDAQSIDEQSEAKAACQNVERIIDSIVPPAAAGLKPDFDAARARDNALQALEECYMWIGKSIRDQQVIRGQAPLQEERGNS
jgi:hypothetical protein